MRANHRDGTIWLEGDGWGEKVSVLGGWCWDFLGKRWWRKKAWRVERRRIEPERREKERREGNEIMEGWTGVSGRS
jgi:hypothetical protein